MTNKKNVNSNSEWLFLYWDEPIFSNDKSEDNETDKICSTNK